MSHGVDAESIVFANPTKLVADLCHAAAMDVRKMTIDGEIELHKIYQLFPYAEYINFQ